MDILYRTEKEEAVVERCLGGEERVEVPERLDGYPVCAIDAYAFSSAAPPKGRREGALEEGSFWKDGNGREICGERLREVRLPKSLRRIGGYAFYGCRNLEKLTLYHRTEDIAGGVFTGCHRVAELELYMEDAFGYCLKDIVSELRGELRVTLHYREETARLLFPEYYEEAVENTPARILETHVHGSGCHYRQCFRDGVLCYPEYDRLFAEAVAWESADFCAELALSRLRAPFGLIEGARERYIAWLDAHRMDAAGWCIEAEQEETLEYLVSLLDWQNAELSGLIRMAHEKERFSMQSFLMDHRHRHTKKREISFVL